jgi:malonyl-CoA decarboxylase
VKNQWFLNIIDSIADRGRELLGLDSGQASQQNVYDLCQRLLAGRGEASGIALSQEILRLYQEMSDADKLAFFNLLAEKFEPDLEHILAVVSKYQHSHSAQDLIDLNTAVEAPRQELFRRLNMAPSGTASLVGLRADLLRQLKTHPSLIAVDADLKHILSSWFNRGFLQLRNIDWTSPAHILEKLINYESVHEIRGWVDLRRRLIKDRRCFAFFHPAMPDEPLIFIEVAFVRGLSNQIQALIDPLAPELDPKQADTAIFYSINNTQRGLRGISFGNFLIKQVLTELTTECPWIKVSSTLSPMPSFASSVQQWLREDTGSLKHLRFDEIRQRHSTALTELAAQYGIDPHLAPAELLQALLQNTAALNNPLLSPLLSELALCQLTTPDAKGRLADPVATFHLSNGARLERINTHADISAQGIASSYGVMVNYLYDLKDVETNHEAFVSQGRIMMSDSLGKKFKLFAKPKD